MAMLQLQDEERILKFYKFYFGGIEDPVIIEAYSSVQARSLLQNALLQMPQEYGYSKVISETVETPVIGISSIRINGIKHLWVGKSTTANGWMEEQEYLKTPLAKNESK